MDTLDTIICPACGKKMEKIFIKTEGINIDICTNGCGGIFFDNREFDKFNEEHEDITAIENALKNKTFQQIAENIERICPACGATMVKNTTKSGGEVQIDDCYICGGKFLDYGELEKIRKEYINDKARKDDAIKYLYQKVGNELHEMNIKAVTNKANRDIAQKLFYSILDLN